MTRKQRRKESWISKKKFWALYALYFTGDVSLEEIYEFVRSMNAVPTLVSCCFPTVPHRPT